MEEARPTMEIGATRSARAQYDVPSQPPPGLAGAGAGTASTLASPGATAAPPTMQSAPSLSASAGIGASVTAWQNNKQVDGLWTINQDLNAWMSIAGIGWRKFSNPNETALTAFAMLASHARSVNANINYRDEADNLVHEIYVW